MSERLFGRAGAEHMHFDIATAYEVEEEYFEPGPKPDVVIEEWTVVTPSVSPHYIGRMIEDLCERMADEGDEGYYDDWERAGNHPEVVGAFTVACGLLASKVTYRMAGELVASHTISHDANGDPFLDGEPLYRKVTP